MSKKRFDFILRFSLFPSALFCSRRLRTGTWTRHRRRPVTGAAAAGSCAGAARRYYLSSSSVPLSTHRASAPRGAPGSPRWSSAWREGPRLRHRRRRLHRRRCPTFDGAVETGEKRTRRNEKKTKKKKSESDFTKRRRREHQSLSPSLGVPRFPLSPLNPWKPRRRRPESSSRETSPGSKVCCR